MRGKKDSPHHAGVFTTGEGSRKFAMATKWLNIIRLQPKSLGDGIGFFSGYYVSESKPTVEQIFI
jgi:hypothetical protein